MRLNRLFLSLLAAAALVAGPAHGLSLKLTDSLGNTTTVDDSGSPGFTLFNGALGNWSINVTSGVSTPVLDPNRMDLNSLNVSNFSAPAPGGYIDIWLSQTGYSAGGIDSLVSFFGEIGGTTQGSLTWMLFADDNNTLFGDQFIVDGGTNATSPIADVLSGAFTLSDTFSLTLYVRINHGSGTRSSSFNYAGSFDAPNQVGEPGTLALIGAGLLGVVMLRRRRQH